MAMDGRAPSFPSEHCAGEPAFALDRAHALVADPGIDGERVRRHLEHAILRDPGDLRAHVQRIGLALDGGDGSYAGEALVDLELALGTRGRALRERMRALAQRAPHARPGVMRAVCGSILRRGLTGKLDLVARKAPARGARDPLDDARELVLHGDLEGALDLLEAAQLADASRTDLAREYATLCAHASLAPRRDAFLLRHAAPAASTAA